MTSVSTIPPQRWSGPPSFTPWHFIFIHFILNRKHNVPQQRTTRKYFHLCYKYFSLNTECTVNLLHYNNMWKLEGLSFVSKMPHERGNNAVNVTPRMDVCILMFPSHTITSRYLFLCIHIWSHLHNRQILRNACSWAQLNIILVQPPCCSVCWINFVNCSFVNPRCWTTRPWLHTYLLLHKIRLGCETNA